MREVVVWYFARALNVYLMRCGTCVTVFCGRGMARMWKRFKCVPCPVHIVRPTEFIAFVHAWNVEKKIKTKTKSYIYLYMFWITWNLEQTPNWIALAIRSVLWCVCLIHCSIATHDIRTADAMMAHSATVLPQLNGIHHLPYITEFDKAQANLRAESVH